MKLVIFLAVAILFVNIYVDAKTKLKNKIKNRKQFPGVNVMPDSVAYGYASNDNYPLQNAAGFKNAMIMEKIPIHLNNPYTGVMANANTVNIYINIVCYRSILLRRKK